MLWALSYKLPRLCIFYTLYCIVVLGLYQICINLTLVFINVITRLYSCIILLKFIFRCQMKIKAIAQLLQRRKHDKDQIPTPRYTSTISCHVSQVTAFDQSLISVHASNTNTIHACFSAQRLSTLITALVGCPTLHCEMHSS